jgi:hypothetical protein
VSLTSDEGWYGIVNIHERISKKILGFPRFATKTVAELELRKGCRRVNLLCTFVKYW